MSVFEKKFLPLAFSIITILLNVIMLFQTFLTNTGNEIFSNVIVIIVVLFLCTINLRAIKIGQERNVRVEYYGILALFGISFIRIANRLWEMPFEINSISLVVFIGFGTFALVVAFTRFLHMKKRK